ncbi:hypothetical protein [Mesorhizobium sp. CAU 1732]|uniref:hypothetical protein n=1 Tax=Mesorhizobium sp. CAU 1732 TaxID=3140358 RepID=UPI0032606789
MDELANLLEYRAQRSATVTLTCETAYIISLKLRTADAKPRRDEVTRAICRRKEPCDTPCFDCTGRANAVVRMYGQHYDRLDLKLPPKKARR